MTKDLAKIEKEITHLREEILKHDEAYEAGRPIITDSEYDRLYYQLVEMERQYPQFRTPDSPTQRIVFKAVDGLTKVRHSEPMLSQEKAHTEEDVDRFLKKVPENDEILVQEKLDGLTISFPFGYTHEIIGSRKKESELIDKEGEWKWKI